MTAAADRSAHVEQLLDTEQARDDDREAPPDPADYCEQCGKPLTRCRAWNEGDHTEADLL